MRKGQIKKNIKHPPGVEPWTFDSGRCSLKGPLLKFQVYLEKTQMTSPIRQAIAKFQTVPMNEPDDAKIIGKDPERNASGYCKVSECASE